MFEAYVTNLGLYPERGAGAGEYLKFPTTVEEVQALFSRIGIDEKQYEEYFITDYDSDILGLTDHLGEYESLDELNYLAHLLEEMTPDELEKLEAVMDAGEYTNSVKDLINLTQNLDCFDFYSDVNSEEELGRMYIQDFEAIQVPEHLIDYIDYEAYGRDIRINDGGHFAPGGYVADNRSNFVEHYTGLDDIPDEYRISKVHARDEKEETHSILAAIKQFSPLMFWCPRTNGYWSPDSLRHLHKQMLAAAGVDESVRFHDLRHTFSTLAIQSGVDAKTVAGMLGHYSAAFTLDTYTHVTEQMKRGAAEKIGVFMNASVNVQVNVVHSPSAVVRGDYESDLANCLNPSNSTDLDPTSQ